jgi:hypothetical protein
MGLPDGYDKSPLHMEVVLLESRDQCQTWNVLSRWPCRFQHSAGSFAAARTSDGRFLRAVTKQSLVPGPFLRCHGQSVPECVVLTREGILVGSMRNGGYSWSDDDGETWHPLTGAPACGYQPMIRQMEDGRIL